MSPLPIMPDTHPTSVVPLQPIVLKEKPELQRIFPPPRPPTQKEETLYLSLSLSCEQKKEALPPLSTKGVAIG